MLVALPYLLLRRLVRLVGGSPSDLNRDVELVALRHQLMVLKRQGRPRLRRRDCVFMAAMSRALPRAPWSSFVPQMLLGVAVVEDEPDTFQLIVHRQVPGLLGNPRGVRVPRRPRKRYTGFGVREPSCWPVWFSPSGASLYGL